MWVVSVLRVPLNSASRAEVSERARFADGSVCPDSTDDGDRLTAPAVSGGYESRVGTIVPGVPCDGSRDVSGTGERHVNRQTSASVPGGMPNARWMSASPTDQGRSRLSGPVCLAWDASVPCQATAEKLLPRGKGPQLAPPIPMGLLVPSAVAHRAEPGRIPIIVPSTVTNRPSSTTTFISSTANHTRS